MASITIIGNLVADPELKFTNTGKAVASFTVAESKRVKGADGTWTDGDSTFWRCSVWDAVAENLAESLNKGQRVIVVGEVKQRSFETQQGEKRSVFEVTASEVAPSLKWAVCKPIKTAAKSGGFTAKKEPEPDPWGSAPAIGGDDLPPF
jgi:single-strand DNA-binding protein